MKVLLTGPSCAGKTNLAKQLSVAFVLHLDSTNDAKCILEPRLGGRGDNTILYEGMLSGSVSSSKAFLDEMDVVLLLEPAAFTRLMRCWQRDGWQHTLRWLRNEWYWRTFCRPLVVQHRNLLRIRWEPL
jgi:uridine kinase